MDTLLRAMTIDDYDAVLALWKAAEGVGLSEADEQPAIARYLNRNPGMSFVACDSRRIIGAVLCGHDGRRGYLHHMVVAPQYRRQGLGRQLAERCLAALAAEGIDKCHLFIFGGNAAGAAFWKRIGWTERTDLAILSKQVHGSH
jgi:ribosomal protein S18 acetylase RimI-like enzyme